MAIVTRHPGLPSSVLVSMCCPSIPSGFSFILELMPGCQVLYLIGVWLKGMDPGFEQQQHCFHGLMVFMQYFWCLEHAITFYLSVSVAFLLLHHFSRHQLKHQLKQRGFFHFLFEGWKFEIFFPSYQVIPPSVFYVCSLLVNNSWLVVLPHWHLVHKGSLFSYLFKIWSWLSF